MDIQTQLRAMADEIEQGGGFDRRSAAGMMRRAARDIDSLTFTVDQWRAEYERPECGCGKGVECATHRQRAEQQDATCGRPWVAEIANCPRCGLGADAHVLSR